jgi:hypothetical protein
MEIIAIFTTFILGGTIITVGIAIWAYIHFCYKSLRAFPLKQRIEPQKIETPSIPAGTLLSYELKATAEEIKELRRKEQEAIINKRKEHQAKIRWN